MTDQISFTIQGTPIPWQRAGRNGKQSFDTARNKNAKDAIAWECKAAMGGQKPLEGPIRLRASFLFDWPSSYTNKRKQTCFGNMKDTKPDVSNLVKLLEDGLNGIAWKDDAQVCEISASKFFSQQEACTRVVIEALWEQESAPLKIVEVMK